MKKIIGFTIFLLLFCCISCIDSPHEHTYSDTYSFDEYCHWHKATCEHVNLFTDRVPHKKQTISSAPSSDGTKLITTYKCSDCGYSWKTFTPLSHEHTFSDTYSYNDYEHFREATCLDTDEVRDKGSHDLKIISNELSSDAKEYIIVKECSVCGYRQTMTSPIDHIHTYSDTYSYDDNYHWMEATCSDTDSVLNGGPHIFDVISNNLSDDGSEYILIEECSFCHYRKETRTPVSKPIIDDDKTFKVIAIEQADQYGDGTLYKYGDFEILIDGGTRNTSSELKRILKENVTDNKIEILISSHPHDDHYGALISSNYNTLYDAGIKNVDKIIDSGADKYGTSYTNNWINAVRKFYVERGATYTPVQTIVKNHHDDAVIKISDELEIQFFDTGNYCAIGEGNGDGNTMSIALVVRYKNYNFFSFGDLPSDCESNIINYKDSILFKNGTINIFKASHHGSNGSNSSALLKKLKLNYCWASSGIVSKNRTSSGIITSQHPYVNARNRIMNQVGKENFYWVGTTGSLTITIENNLPIFKGNGRKLNNYYYKGSIVNPETEKDLPFYLTKYASANK